MRAGIDYARHYKALVNRADGRPRPEGYSEKHHVADGRYREAKSRASVLASEKRKAAYALLSDEERHSLGAEKAAKSDALLKLRVARKRAKEAALPVDVRAAKYAKRLARMREIYATPSKQAERHERGILTRSEGNKLAWIKKKTVVGELSPELKLCQEIMRLEKQLVELKSQAKREGVA